MTNIETSVYEKTTDGIIGAEVIVYNGDEEIDNIKIVTESQFEELAAQLEVIDDTYIRFADGSSLTGKTIDELLTNHDEDVTINATNLNGYQSDSFSKTNHTHDPSEFSSPNYVSTYVDTNMTNHIIITRVGQLAVLDYYLSLKAAVTTNDNNIVTNIPSAFQPARSCSEIIQNTSGIRFLMTLTDSYIRLKHYHSGNQGGTITGQISYKCNGSE